MNILTGCEASFREGRESGRRWAKKTESQSCESPPLPSHPKSFPPHPLSTKIERKSQSENEKRCNQDVLRRLSSRLPSLYGKRGTTICFLPFIPASGRFVMTEMPSNSLTTWRGGGFLLVSVQFVFGWVNGS